MGVPTITLSGSTAVSRAGRSIMANVDLPGFVASNPEQYVHIAVGLASDLARLAELRTTLRSTLRCSPLMDGPQFVADIESAFRQMWRRWCMGRNGSEESGKDTSSDALGWCKDTA
jgi:protein O-GlcNAc transferase